MTAVTLINKINQIKFSKKEIEVKIKKKENFL